FTLDFSSLSCVSISHSSHCLPSLLFFFYSSRSPRDLHSFPTRRSSDLISCLARASLCLPLPVRWLLPRWPALRPVQWSSSALSSDRKSTRLNSSHVSISYAVFCLKKKKQINNTTRALNSYSRTEDDLA